VRSAVLCPDSRRFRAETFTLDPEHTFPSFEIGHQGISVMRGKFNRSKGRAMFDAEKQQGAIDVRVDASSGDTGHDGLNKKLLVPISSVLRSFRKSFSNPPRLNSRMANRLPQSAI
jgi:polyisoprenoid-binding protein YceI